MSVKSTDRTAAIVRLVVWSLVAILLISILAVSIGSGDLGQKSFFGISIFGGEVYPDGDSYNVGNREYGETVSGIDLSWTAGSVKIVIWDGECIKLEEDGEFVDDLKMRSKVENGELIVKYARSGLKLLSVQPSKQLTVYIPYGMAGDIKYFDFDSASADILVDGGYPAEAQLSLAEVMLDLNEMDIDTASGKVKLDFVNADEVDIDTASGNIYLNGAYDSVDIDAASADVTVMNNVKRLEVDIASGSTTLYGVADTVNISAVSGKVTLGLSNIPSQINVENVSGNVDITVPADIAGFKARLESVSGDMRLDEFGNVSQGKSLIYGNSGATFEFDTVSGSVYISILAE